MPRRRREAHPPRYCRPVPGTYSEHGRTAASEYVQSQRFACPCCGRDTRQILNYLGGMRMGTEWGVANPLMCTGDRFVFPKAQTTPLRSAALAAEVAAADAAV